MKILLTLILIAILNVDLQAQTEVLAIRGATVVDVTDGSLNTDQTVLIRGNRIIMAGSVAEVAVPNDVVVVEAEDRYLIPGLWDMHAHATTYDGRVESFMRLLLANGITGLRDPFGSMEVAAGTRVTTESGELPGPARMIVAGNLIDGPPGPVPGALIAAMPDEGRALVDSLHSAGAPFIKVYSMLPPETYFAITERSRELGIPFEGHVPFLLRAADASDAGQRSIEHLTGVFSGCSTEESEILTDMRKLFGLGDMAAMFDQYMEPARRALATQDEGTCMRLMQRFIENETWQVPTLVSLRGKAYLREFAVEAGLTPLQALQAATLNPARFLGRTDELGTIDEGKLADLVLLDANPLEDIRNTQKIRAVVADGRLFRRTDLDKILAEVESMNQTPEDRE